jgi:hypothetical protein
MPAGVDPDVNAVRVKLQSADRNAQVDAILQLRHMGKQAAPA